MRRLHQYLVAGAFIFSSLSFLWFLKSSTATYDWGVLRWPSYAHKSPAAELEAEESLLQADLVATKVALDSTNVNQTQSGDGGEGEAEDKDAKPSPAGETDGFAYVFYATMDQYACSVLVNIHRLKELGSRYPVYLLLTPAISDRYKQAFEAAGVTIFVQEAPPLKDNQNGYYKDCMLKLLTFKMQELEPYLKRVLAFDSDQLVMRNLDSLFTGLPAVDLAAPRAYWLAKDFLSSTFLFIDLSERLWRTVKSALDSVGYNKFDMDLINDLLGDTVMMLSGEYVTVNSHWEDWNLPNWYHPTLELNMTSIKTWNEIVKSGGVIKARSPDEGQGMVNTGDSSSPGPPDVAVNPPAVALTPSEHQNLPPPLPTPSSNPRFPDGHPLSTELHHLQDAAAVIHFYAVGKPWTKTAADIHLQRPDAHPLLAEQFALWRKIAEEVCPGGIPAG